MRLGATVAAHHAEIGHGLVHVIRAAFPLSNEEKVNGEDEEEEG